jgi:hypothetical protein
MVYPFLAEVDLPVQWLEHITVPTVAVCRAVIALLCAKVEQIISLWHPGR